MYIKSIVLDGFKSYGERTEISGFDPLFNAITGLNGTGKSNILDSICFVLGITNLTHVRAENLQDLIYKKGQAGVNKATVSITFDNSNPAQCPSGFENQQEIIITRQIILGGKNKYLINGVNVLSKKVQDLFCSIQLNVNNPHFLIMQGRITKVLNMKPQEILSMVEEAAGTKMYEVKKQHTQKVIEKKDGVLSESQSVIKEELQPRLEEMRKERKQYVEYQKLQQELKHLMNRYQAWQYCEAKRNCVKTEKALENGEAKIKNNEEKIEQNKNAVKQLEAEIKAMASKNDSEEAKKLQEVEEQLKAKEKEQAKVIAKVNAAKEKISIEEQKKSLVERNADNDREALTAKENQLNEVQSVFQILKDNDRKDTEAFGLAEKKYEALCAGMELNDQGETETLADQLMSAREEASKASTESKQASMQLKFCQDQLNSKRKEANAISTDYEKDQVALRKTEKEVTQLENSIKNLNFSEAHMTELNKRQQTLHHETRVLRDRLERFVVTKPHVFFKYRDPETNFNRSRVKGVVCKLFRCKDDKYATALETVAGGRLYNVITDTDVTSKKLLERGDLQTRTTFIPLNKITAYKMDQGTIKLAQDLVGGENCQPALSLINYDKSLQAAMEYIFGSVFICKDINIAKKVTFNDRIRKKCVTLDGDSTDPGGVLSGGAKQKGESILKAIVDIQVIEDELNTKERELAQIEQEIRKLTGAQEQFNNLKYKLDMAKNELNILKQRLFNTSFAIHQREIENLQTEIAKLQEKVTSCQKIEKQCTAKAKDLETKMKDSAGYRENRLKEAEKEMKQAKVKADKSKKEWEKREKEYETLTLEIQELKKGIENTKGDIKNSEENIKKLQSEFNDASEESQSIKNTVQEIHAEIKRLKGIINEKSQELKEKTNRKEQFLAENTEIVLENKKLVHEIKELRNAYKAAKHKEQEYSKKTPKNDVYMQQGEKLTKEEGYSLEKTIKISQEKIHTLSRTINTQGQKMFEADEKTFEEMIKKETILHVDRQKIKKTIKELDEDKQGALQLAYQQVSKDFGSIFATLLPGSNAKLVAVQGQNGLQGLEIKVSLGNVWKENLSELSGGQRSLAALSLILAMLLFKPAPLYILDEVDAALDLSHTQNIGLMLKTHFKKSQFIVVSLKDGMFNNANVLFRTKFINNVSTVQRTQNSKNH